MGVGLELYDATDIKRLPLEVRVVFVRRKKNVRLMEPLSCVVFRI